MKKRSLISVVATIIFTFNLTTVAFAEPNTSAEQTIQENKAKYDQLDDETLKLNAEIKKLNNDIEEINLKLDKNNSEIKSTEIEIENINNKKYRLNISISHNKTSAIAFAILEEL